MEISGARVLVVGATGVLGEALTRRLVDGGATVALTGRRKDALQRLGREVGARHTRLLDLVDVEACSAAVLEAAEVLGGLDALLVASGVAAFGPARDEQDAVMEELFAVNTFAPMALVRSAVPLMSAGGAVAVITAVVADTPVAGMAGYSASKAAISAYLTAVRREIRGDKISVLDARPSHMETGLASRALSGPAPKMPPGGDVDVVIDLILQGMVEGRRELVADLKTGTLTLR